jgi:hypothetical protein
MEWHDKAKTFCPHGMVRLMRQSRQTVWRDLLNPQELPKLRASPAVARTNSF